MWTRVTVQPVLECLHGNITLLATFSMARLRMLPSGPRHVGQHDSFGRQLEHTRCPLWHCRIGGNTYSKHTGHSNSEAKSADMAVGAFTRAGTPGTEQLEPLAPRRLLFVLMSPSRAHKTRLSTITNTARRCSRKLATPNSFVAFYS